MKNQPAIQLARNKMVKQQTRHIKLKHDWIRGRIEENKLWVDYKETDENLTDMFTKALSQKSLENFT